MWSSNNEISGNASQFSPLILYWDHYRVLKTVATLIIGTRPVQASGAPVEDITVLWRVSNDTTLPSTTATPLTVIESDPGWHQVRIPGSSAVRGNYKVKMVWDCKQKYPYDVQQNAFTIPTLTTNTVPSDPCYLQICVGNATGLYGTDESPLPEYTLQYFYKVQAWDRRTGKFGSSMV